MGKKKRMMIVPEERNLRVTKSLTGEEEQPHAVIQQAIDSGSLSGGGLKNPASLPGGSGVLPLTVLSQPEEKTSDIEKIKDAANYVPSKVSDEVLRDDFRIVLAWFASWRKSPETFMYSGSFLHQLLRKILEEAKRRGPEVITFHPAKMDSDTKPFFLDIAEDVGLPPSQLQKADKLAPDSNPEEMTTRELKGAHWALHLMYRRSAKGLEPGFTVEGISNLHSRIVDTLFGRGILHPAPPDDGLDDASSSFEKNGVSQPDWTKFESSKPVRKSEEDSEDESEMDEREKCYSEVSEKDLEP